MHRKSSRYLHRDLLKSRLNIMLYLYKVKACERGNEQSERLELNTPQSLHSLRGISTLTRQSKENC